LPNDPIKLRRSLFQEAFDHASTQVFGTNEKRPGQVRTQPYPGGEFPPSQVLISRINGLRTGQFVPRLAAGEYTSEVQQTCQMELDENNNPKQVCETQTTNCPSGTAFDGICLRLHPVEIGGNVVLEGMNFSSIDTKVQLTDMNGNVRQLNTYVCGDEYTPLTEIVNGKEVPIIDSRVHDRLSFIGNYTIYSRVLFVLCVTFNRIFFSNSFELSNIHITFRAEGLDCAISSLF